MEKINKVVKLLESGQLVLKSGLNSYLPNDLKAFLNQNPENINAILGEEGNLDDLINLLNLKENFDVDLASDLWSSLILFEVLTSEDYVDLLERNLILGREQSENPMMDNFSKKMFDSLLKNAEDELLKAELYNNVEIDENALNVRNNIESIFHKLYSDDYEGEYEDELKEILFN